MMSDDIFFAFTQGLPHQWSYFPISVVDNWDVCYSIFSYQLPLESEGRSKYMVPGEAIIIIFIWKDLYHF